jgi:excinuclease UvrABC ATPase subunit
MEMTTEILAMALNPPQSMVHMLKNIKWQLPPSTLLLVEKQKQSLKGTLYLMTVQLEAQTKLMKQREPI